MLAAQYPRESVSSEFLDCTLDMDNRWFLVDRWGRRAILLSGAVIVRFQLSSELTFINLLSIDGHCSRCHRLLDAP